MNVEGNISAGDCTLSAETATCELPTFLAHGLAAVRDGVYSQGMESPSHLGYYSSPRFCDPATPHLHARELVEMSAKEDLARRMAALSVPSPYIGGAPGGVCARSVELLRRARVSLSLIEPSGRWPSIDRPARFAETLRDSLLGLSI